MAALASMVLIGAAIVGYRELSGQGYEAVFVPSSPSTSDQSLDGDSGSGDSENLEQTSGGPVPEIVDLGDYSEADTLRLEIPLQSEVEAGTGADVGTDPDSEIEVDPTLEPLQLIIADGKISLNGAVRSEEQATAMIDRAGEVFGDAEVVSNYEVNPRAPEPSTGVVVQKPVVFEPGSAEIRDEFKPILDACADVMAFNPTLVMTVTGHTDDVGSDGYNLNLAERRAQAVIDYYVESGLDRQQFDPASRGERSPLSSNATDEGRRNNRRTDLEFEGIFDNILKES